MSIAHYAISFIHLWEKECTEQEFSLRFPMFSDFLIYLELNIERSLFVHINRDKQLLENLRNLFYSMLKTYIRELCIKEENSVA